MFLGAIACFVILGILAAGWASHRSRRTIQRLTSISVDELGLRAIPSEDHCASRWCDAMRAGAESGKYEAFDLGVRPYACEGAAARDRTRIVASRHAVPWDRYEDSYCFGVGMVEAIRHGLGFESVMGSCRRFAPAIRYRVLDGYGFWLALTRPAHNRELVQRIQAIPGYARRAAFQGVGRALYLAHLSDRRGLIEAISDLAPKHDLDLVEGAAYAAAYMHPGEPRAALAFTRAMPYEWRAHAHLGMTLGFRAWNTAEPDYFAHCLESLPARSRLAVAEALRMADEPWEFLEDRYGPGGYSLWREELCRRLEAEQVWSPVYDESLESRPGGRNAMR